MASKEGATTSKQDEGLPEYVLRFHPPIVMHNLLPYDVTITLSDARSGKAGGNPAQVGTWNIRVGGSEDVYFFDLSKKLKMGVEMQVYCHTAQATYVYSLTTCSVHEGASQSNRAATNSVLHGAPAKGHSSTPPRHGNTTSHVPTTLI